MNPITVLACEAQPIVVEGLEKVLAGCDDLVFAGFVRGIGDAFEAVTRIRPDVVLIDLSSGLTSALRLVASLKAPSPTSQGVLWVVDLPEIETFRALQMGVRGIVRKTLPVPNLLECLRVVGSGRIARQSRCCQGRSVTKCLGATEGKAGTYARLAHRDVITS